MVVAIGAGSSLPPIPRCWTSRIGFSSAAIDGVPAGWYNHFPPRTPPHADFSEVYVAGAHFYFSLYLIQNRIPFYFFEDAAGMLSKSQELYETLAASFPTHAKIARKYRLFNGENPYIYRVICLKKAQTIDVSDERYLDFSVEEALQNLPERERKNLIHFFLKHRLWTKAEAILLTQHFANLNMMSEEGFK